MEDVKAEILESAKLLMGIETSEHDAALGILIEDTVNEVLSYCRIEVLPRQLVSLIPVIAEKKYRAVINTGVKSLTEGDRRVEYADSDYDYLSAYASRLKPFVSRSVKVPSELDAKGDGNESV